MYFRILSKDLKRKKTMNIILLIFIILASTFIASSTNNLLVISNAMDSYLQKAELSDYLFIALKDERNDKEIVDFLNNNKYVKDWSVDENVNLASNDIKLSNGKNINMAGAAFINSYHVKQQKFFDSDNKEITNINDGEIYVPIKLLTDNNLHSGDVITIKSGNYRKNFTIKGNCKDAFLGSSMMGSARFIVNDNDFKQLKSNTDFEMGAIYSVNSDHLKAFEKEFNNMGFVIILACDKQLISFSYIMDMMIAGFLLVVSACLIVISLLILRFTIVFTLKEEFREIGIMKAIGIKVRKIRGLYIIKYLAISTIGVVIGYLCSIPFGNMFLRQVSKNIILSDSVTGRSISLLCSVLIIAIVILFCYLCTRQVNKFSPIDAIRNGSDGERFKRKGILNLNKSRLSATLFMAVNDIVSGLRKYSILIITFTIGIILIIDLTNSINTLKSDKLVKWFGMVESDVYLRDVNNFKEFRENGPEFFNNKLEDIEDTLQENGMPVSAFYETTFKFKISKNETSYSSLGEQGFGVTADQYSYTNGQPPKYANEVALTKITAGHIDAKIGDTVNIKTGDAEKEYIVTGYFQSMSNLGEGIRFSEKEKLDSSRIIGISPIQLKFKDHPSAAKIKERFKELEKIYPGYEVITGGEYISDSMGDVAGQLQGVKNLIITVTIMINILVAVLMEKTFITKEKGEIGMLKSIGFSNFAIVKWQTMRIGIVLLISSVLSVILSNPVAKISTEKIFEMMGASHIEMVIKPLEVYVVYPVIIFVFTMVASILTASRIRRITARETNNIE